MAEPFVFEEYTITPVDIELEVNYIISDLSGYICRLVPGEAGFEISKADKALGTGMPLLNLYERNATKFISYRVLRSCIVT